MGRVDFQETLNEIVEERQLINDQNTQMLIKILERKNEETQRDFMREFEENLKTIKKEKNHVQGKLNEKINEEDEDILISDMIKQDTQKQEKDEISDENEIEGEEQEGITEEELNDKYPQDDLTMNQKKYAYMYETAMKEYYKLKINLEKQNIRDGDVCYDDRNFLKLMRLKDVAVKSETYFRNSKKQYIGEVIPEIAEMENANERECADYQRQNNKDHEKANERIYKIKEEIEECLDEINSLTKQIASGNTELSEKLQAKNAEYVELSEKLEMISPNPLELARQEAKSREQEELTTYYSETVKNKVSDAKGKNEVNNTNKHQNIGKALDENGSNVTLDELEKIRVESFEETKEALNNAIENKDYKAAYAIVTGMEEMAKDMVEPENIEMVNNIVEVKEEIVEQIQQSDGIENDGLVEVAAALSSEDEPIIGTENEPSVEDSIQTATDNVENKEEIEEQENSSVEIESEEIFEDEIFETTPVQEDTPNYEYPSNADVGENDFKKNIQQNGVESPENIAEKDAQDEKILKQVENISRGEKTIGTQERDVQNYEDNNATR